MKILFCCDGSREAEKAVRFGVLIAVACEAEPTILGIAETAEDEDELLKDLRRVQDIFTDHNLRVELIAKVGRPVSEIVRCAEETDYDLVVIGAARKNALWRLFDPMWMSVGVYKIIESIEPPVLVVVGSSRELRRVMLCTGGAEYIDKAVEFTGKIAQAVNAVVDLVHVMPETPAMYADLVRFEEDADFVLASNSKLGQALRHQKNLLDQLGVFGTLVLRQGRVLPELLKEIKRTGYDLVVSGSLPANENWRKYVMGDVAREIVNRSEIPVLVMRTGERIPVIHLVKEFLERIFRRSRRTSESLDI